MRELNVFCEGQTEQQFCAQVLQRHLFPQEDGIIHTLAVGEKDHHHVYGIGRRKYQKVRKFIQNTIKQRGGNNVFFTTLFDLYGLPNDFPGKANNTRDSALPTSYVTALEKAFGEDINYYGFMAYLQLHEYETILFAEPEAFAISFENCDAEVRQLKAIAASEPSIEHINDSKETAPSKRIIKIIPEYEGRKSSAGPDIAEFTGLPVIRAKCLHFDNWLSRLEDLPWTSEL